MRIGHFRLIFQHCSHPSIFLQFFTALLDKQERFAKIGVSKYLLCKFLWHFKNCQIGFRMSFFFLSPHISDPQIFEHFLIELEC